MLHSNESSTDTCNKMVKIDDLICVGCGACAEICPESFEMIDGHAKIKNQKSKKIKTAIDACPVEAIK